MPRRRPCVDRLPSLPCSARVEGVAPKVPAFFSLSPPRLGPRGGPAQILHSPSGGASHPAGVASLPLRFPTLPTTLGGSLVGHAVGACNPSTAATIPPLCCQPSYPLILRLSARNCCPMYMYIHKLWAAETVNHDRPLQPSASSLTRLGGWRHGSLLQVGGTLSRTEDSPAGIPPGGKAALGRCSPHPGAQHGGRRGRGSEERASPVTPTRFARRMQQQLPQAGALGVSRGGPLGDSRGGGHNETVRRPVRVLVDGRGCGPRSAH